MYKMYTTVFKGIFEDYFIVQKYRDISGMAIKNRIRSGYNEYLSIWARRAN